MPSDAALPPWQAYRLLCDHLGRCIDPACAVAPTPPQWEQFVLLSSHHLVTPALAWCLKDAPSVPHEAREYFDGVLTLNRLRNERVERTLHLILDAWKPAGIPSMLLKGASTLTYDLYPDPGMRVIGDIDVLVPAARAGEADRLLTAAGFETLPSEIDYTTHHHLAPLGHPETGIGVEIHTHVLLNRFRPFLAADTAWASAEECAFQGVPTRRLAATEEFVHAFVHAHLVDNSYFASTISLRRLLDLALLAHRRQSEIDWERVAALFRARNAYPVLADGLDVLVRLFGIARPAAIAAPRGGSLRALRRRVEGRFGAREIWHASRRKIAENPYRLLNLVKPGSWRSYFGALDENRRRDHKT